MRSEAERFNEGPPALRHKTPTGGVAVRAMLAVGAPALVAAAVISTIFAARETRARAEAKLREAEAIRQAAIAETANDFLNNELLAAMNNNALLLDDLGRHDEAGSIYEELLEIQEKAHGPEHPDALRAVSNLASHRLREERFDEAIDLYQRALDGRLALHGDDHPSAIAATGDLAIALLSAKRYAEAVPHFEWAIEIYRRDQPESWMTGDALVNHGRCLAGLDLRDEAERTMKYGHAILVAALGADHRRVRAAAVRIGDYYERWGRIADAIEWRDRHVR